MLKPSISILRTCRSVVLLAVATCRFAYGQPEGIQITSPADGTVVFPNQTIAIMAEPVGGVSLEEVLFLTSYSGELVDTPPFFANFTIPAEAAGFVDVTAYGRSTSGEFFSNHIALLVRSDGVLEELSVEPERFSFFRAGHRRQIIVRGLFDDGVTRDLSSLGAGTSYSSSAPSVVSVDGNGRMWAGETGSAVVSVSNAGRFAEVAVEVDIIPTPVADAGPTQVVECVSLDGAPVTLDGSSSYDPDGDPLAFEWSERGGTVLGTAPVVELPFSIGTHEAILIVDDGDDGVARDVVVFAVRDTVPPVLSDVPDSVRVEQPGREDANVNLPLPTGTDLCDALVEVSSDAPASFPLGETIVTFTATDDSGNRATATTTVEVIQVVIRGDLDFDGDVDRRDYVKLIRRLRSPAQGPEDPADLDGDMRITIRDAKILVTLCTRPHCAVR